MKSEDDILEVAARDGSIEFTEWPRVLDRVISRLEEIVHKDFPASSLPLPSTARAPNDKSTSTQSEVTTGQDSSSQYLQSSNKENTPPNSPPSRPPVPPFINSPHANVQTPNDTLHPQLVSLLGAIKTVLTTTFAHTPPHTIQRLSELILRPRTHYRSLPSYLRAVDRVVSVSSGADIFPLPSVTLSLSSEGGKLLNGTSNTVGGAGSPSGLGSDESLGGALLTPIPWLRDHQGEVRTESTQTIDGPNGTGSIETVSISINGIASHSHLSPQGESLRDSGAVTQGELLRQEQEAGVVPVAQAVGRQPRSTAARGVVEVEAEGEDHPHARGPEEIGMEDMGPQDLGAKKGGFDVEAAIGRSMPRASAAGGEERTGATNEGHDKDSEREDVVLADADGKTEGDDSKSNLDRETVVGDVVNMSTQ